MRKLVAVVGLAILIATLLPSSGAVQAQTASPEYGVVPHLMGYPESTPGDVALITFANLVRSELRTGELFARLGGDEFAVFCPPAAASAALDVVRAIYARIARTPFRYDGADYPFTVSSGIASAHAGDSLESLRRRADQALYEAKRQGRARWIVAEAPLIRPSATFSPQAGKRATNDEQA